MEEEVREAKGEGLHLRALVRLRLEPHRLALVRHALECDAALQKAVASGA